MSGKRFALIILGDADILGRVIGSLLHNGIKFSPPHGGVLGDCAPAIDPLDGTDGDPHDGIGRERRMAVVFCG